MMTDTTPRPSWFTQTTTAIDSHGPKAWIALMVLGFVFGGPLGLLVLGFILATGRFKRATYPHLPQRAGRCGSTRVSVSRTTGNAAFDSYKLDTIARLEREQAEFEAFLAQLRASRDKAEFDQYLAERARIAAQEQPAAETDKTA